MNYDEGGMGEYPQMMKIDDERWGVETPKYDDAIWAQSLIFQMRPIYPFPSYEPEMLHGSRSWPSPATYENKRHDPGATHVFGQQSELINVFRAGH